MQNENLKAIKRRVPTKTTKKKKCKRKRKVYLNWFPSNSVEAKHEQNAAEKY